MADIGDVDAEPDEPVDMFDRDGVVEVARVDRVDREREDVPKVLATGALLGFDALLDAFGLFEHALGELGGEPVLADDDLELDARIALPAEHFLDIALCGLVAGGIGSEPCDDDVPVARVGCLACAHDDLAAHSRVGGGHEANGPVAFEPSHHGRGLALDDAHDGAASTLAPSLGLGAHRHDVSVHCPGGVSCRNVDVALGGIDETVAATGERDPADDQTAAIRLLLAFLPAHVRLLLAVGRGESTAQRDEIFAVRLRC